MCRVLMIVVSAGQSKPLGGKMVLKEKFGLGAGDLHLDTVSVTAMDPW